MEPQEWAEWYRFGMAFGWAPGAAPGTVPSATGPRPGGVADLSATAQHHYTALQVWKGQHASFLQRPLHPMDADAADAEEWQQALQYASQEHLAPHGIPAGPWNRVVLAPSGVRTRTGNHRILYVLPAGLERMPGPGRSGDPAPAAADLYTTALALYLYRTLEVTANDASSDDDDDDQVSIVVDVRSGGPAWPNPGVLTLLPFLRHVSRVLPRFFPQRVSQVLVGPLPGWACHLHHWAVAPLLPAALRLTLLPGPSTAMTAALPTALADYLRGGDDDRARLEQLRRAALRRPAEPEAAGDSTKSKIGTPLRPNGVVVSKCTPDI
jgi:hypothetical protein